jgi:ABC-type transport system substrate-binding protein
MRSIRTTRNASARGRVAGVATLLALGQVACARSLPAPIPAERGEAAPRRGGTIHLATAWDVRSLDPAGPGEALAGEAMHLIFAGLVDLDDRAHVVADLAERWEVVDDGRTYRFFLRHGVVMHDGQELTADDVKRSVERALHPSSPTSNASTFDGIVGFDDFAAQRADDLTGVAVEGRYVVTFTLREPDAAFLSRLAMQTLRPVCRTGGRRYSDLWLPCGGGPFKLEPGGWQRGTSLRLARHDSYFRAGLPYADAVEWTYNVQLLVQRFRFESGNLDVIRDLTQADQRRFSADTRWQALGQMEADTTVYGESMNTRMPPFDNVEIRRAVAAAIDRQHYRLLKPAYLTVLTQLIPPGVPGYDPSLEGQRHDDAAALEHMRRAGYPYDPVTGKGGWPRPIEYPLYDQGLLVYTAQLLKQDLAKIGLRIELRLVSWQAFLALQERPLGAALSQGNWAMDYPDPSSFFDPLFTTRAIGPEGGRNTAFFSNPRFDDLVAQAHRETHESNRNALYHEANALLCDEAPWAFAYSSHAYLVHQPYLRGFAPHPVWIVDVTRAWLDRTSGSLRRALVQGLR